MWNGRNQREMDYEFTIGEIALGKSGLRKMSHCRKCLGISLLNRFKDRVQFTTDGIQVF